MKLAGQVGVNIELTARAKPEPGQTLEELEAIVVAAGNKIIEREADALVILRES